MSGGGSWGAFQAGVLRSIFRDELDREYGFLSGVSVGALNSAFIAQAQEGDLGLYTEKLIQMWQDIRGNKDVWKSSFWGIFRSLWATGLRKTDPLREMVYKNLDLERIRSSKRILRVGAVDLISGSYAEGSETSENLQEWVLASSSFPVFFPCVDAFDGLWTDGGIRNITPLASAVAAGCDEIDVIVTNPGVGRVATRPREKLKSTIDVALRLIEIMLDEVFITDLRICYDRNTLAEMGKTYRFIPVNVYAPPKPLEGDPLEFDPVLLRDRILLGEGVTSVPLESFLTD